MALADSSTSSRFLDLIREHDREAWNELLKRFGPRVYERCRATGISVEDSEQLAQEVFTAVSRGIRSFRKSGSHHGFRRWLRTITNNKIRDHFRKHSDDAVAAGGSTAIVLLLEYAHPEGDSSSVRELNGEYQALAERLIALAQSDFTEQTWRAFWMTVVDELDAPTIASELGMTPGTVRQAAYRVRRHLKEEFRDWLPDE